MNVMMPARDVVVELIAGRGHYERVIAALRAAHTSVWIATANVKELYVSWSGGVGAGRARARGGKRHGSIFEVFEELVTRGVELRLLHAELPSRPFRAELARHKRLLAAEGGLALRRCPRVHLKMVIVDGMLLYMGSANWTGAGIGARGEDRRNFELGIVTADLHMLDQTQAMFEHLWSGGECQGCGLREICPGPLDDLQ